MLAERRKSEKMKNRRKKQTKLGGHLIVCREVALALQSCTGDIFHAFTSKGNVCESSAFQKLPKKFPFNFLCLTHGSSKGSTVYSCGGSVFWTCVRKGGFNQGEQIHFKDVGCLGAAVGWRLGGVQKGNTPATSRSHTSSCQTCNQFIYIQSSRFIFMTQDTAIILLPCGLTCIFPVAIRRCTDAHTHGHVH